MTFRQEEAVTADGNIPISLYVSETTGLRVVIAQVDCPIVKGDLVFATEAFDDDGLPHTLEHLVFMGSEDYPYKGVLDLLANRCLASGTNALTDTDYTNYTLSTAGSEGFLNLLPIYLNHLLFPTLTDSAFATEVHHINGDGEDAGIVYCEMQARENSGESRCYLEMLRALYPGICGYKSETGGLVENLRTSTTNTKVRDYHKKFYHSKNLCIVVTGPVEAEEIFKALKPIEDKIVTKNMHKISYERPWSTPVEPLAKSEHRRLKYSSDTDEDGLVYIGFRGPKVTESYSELVSLSIVLDYLNATAISPIQRDFVECEDPYCSSVSHDIIENSTSCFYLTFESVGKRHLESISAKLDETIHKIVDKKEKFDLDRVNTIIARKIVRILSAAETSPHAIVIGTVIGHFLYGSKGDLQVRCQEIPILRNLLKESSDFWINLVDRYILKSERVYIIGEPSPEQSKLTSKLEQDRIAAQKESLKNELPEISEKLKKFVELNEIPPPLDMINSVNVPSADNIKFHSIERVVLPTQDTSFRFQYDSIKTNFVAIHVLMNTSECLTREQRLYLPLMSEMIFESAIKKGDQEMPYEKVVAGLFSDTVSYGAGIGLSSSSFYSVGLIGMLFGLMMQVEIDKYERAVEWLNDVIHHTVFTVERIKSIATRMVSDISQHKRSGSKVASATINSMTYTPESNQWAANFVRQQNFLKQLLKKLKANPNSVQKELYAVKDSMSKPENLLVHLSLDKNKIDVTRLYKPWAKFVVGTKHLQISDIIPCHKLVKFIDEPKSAIVGLGSVESNYMHQIVPSISSPKHPDLPAIYVLIQYLTQLEGPLWRQLRGLGLAYNYGIQVVPSEGLLYLYLSQSTHVFAAYNKAKEIIDCYLTGEEEFEDTLFESAKSSLIYEFIKREKSAAGKSMQSLIAYLRDLDIDFNRDLIKRVSKVTKDDLRKVGPLYLKALFHDENMRSAICCRDSKVDDVIKDFKTLNYCLKKISLEGSEEYYLNSFD